MKVIKKYFSSWDLTRKFKLGFGVVFVIAYFSTNEVVYLFGGFFFAIQALLNMGCPGNTCATPTSKNDQKQVMTFDKYEPNKESNNV